MTRRDLAAERHGSTASSGADSFKSTDTVRNIFQAGAQRRRGTPVNVETKEENRYVPV
jgi:adenylate cyclase